MDFNTEVIEKSNSIPVVVDFWAPWCGPCRFLGPVIEELAARDQGKWELVKVNTDENRELMAAYQIQGIPAVKMFHKGEVIADFTGALPRHQIDAWLDEYLPDERKDKMDELIREAQTGSLEQVKKLQHFVEANPDLKGGTLALAEVLVLHNPDKALKLVTDIKAGNPDHERAEHIRNLGALFSCSAGENETLDGKIEDARNHLKEGNLDAALGTLVEAVMIDKNYCNELPRKATIALFNVLGPDHELTKKYRRRFDMALY